MSKPWSAFPPLHRIAYFDLTPEFLLHALQGRFNGGRSDLPADAQFVAAYYDDQRHLFRVHIASESFDEVREGDRIPCRVVTFTEARCPPSSS